MELFRYINQMSNSQRRLIESMAADREYSGNQGKVMHFLLIEEGRTVYQKDLEKIFGFRAATATELLKGMEKKGYIKRVTSSEDARFKEIILTDKARSLRSELIFGIDRLERTLTEGLTSEEQQVWLDITKRIISNLERSRDE